MGKVFKYYWAVFRLLPKKVVSATDMVATMLTLFLLILIALAAVFNFPIGNELIQDQWAGFDPVWIFIAIGVVLCLMFLRANYECYAKVEGERDAVIAEMNRLSDVSHQLARFVVEGQQQTNNIYNGVGEVPDKVAMFNNEWVPKVRTFLSKEIPDQLSTFDLDDVSTMSGTREKMQFKVDRLRDIEEWFSTAPTLSPSGVWNDT